MTKYDLLKINSSLIKIMSHNDIKTIDVSFIEIYEGYIEKRKHMKYSAAIAELAQEFSKSERTISRIIAQLQEDMKL